MRFPKERAFALIGPFITIQDMCVDVRKPAEETNNLLCMKPQPTDAVLSALMAFTSMSETHSRAPQFDTEGSSQTLVR